MAVMAVTVQTEDDGKTCADARIAIGAVREKPVRPTAAEAALAGAVLDEALIAKVAADAAREVNPLPHHGFSKRHLVDNIGVYLRRTLAQAVERARL